MIESVIKNVKFQYVNVPSRRHIKVAMTSGNIITIVPCYESYEQFGGFDAELWKTLPIAKKYNDWLHGID